ncbi:MBL fold metallo-hydrolase [Pontibacter sp. KCTC 32443]|uniref:MBL fold metallo-hydrolase n=1 Tax=Pontibacter TaxID=323449 RepID=UPI00164DBE88|nr:MULTISPECIES: MBL fold metallo-hydrolase [Pontibacter]MBC5773056.1 MBL fold metallo-hydrolase [Pontibacter sp. KCTC 32443]
MDVFVLVIKYSHQGQDEVLYPVLLRSDSELVLVDCGYAGSLPLLQEAANKYGLSSDNLTGIIITHHDIDHMGGLKELKAAYPKVKVYASETEAPYISGRKKSLRLQQAEALYNTLPGEQKAWAWQFQESLKAVQPVNVDVVLTEKEVPASWGNIQIIPTPGHMPGHFSIYIPQSKTLVAADAVVAEQDELELANPTYTLNLEQAVASVRKLQQLDVDRIICYHGGVVENDIGEKLQKLVARYTPSQPAPFVAEEPQEVSSPVCYAHLKEFREGF